MIDVKEALKSAEDKMKKSANFLEAELSRIRAGRANLAILDSVRVMSYGQPVPLNQVAALQIPDARTITIRPWERKAIKDIEKGIMDSDVGITPENNGEMVILRLPQPTEQRRKELVKAIKDGLSEDQEKDAEDSLQKLHDKFIKQVDATLANKQKEIMTI